MTTTATPFKPKDYASPRWAFMRSRDIGYSGDVYMRRVYVLMTPWFGIMFHRIFRPDRQRDLHDHPWNFFSLVLRGRYEEEVDCPTCRAAGDFHPEPRTVRWWNYKRAEDRHRIAWVSRSPVWTLVFTGRKRRKWGFWVDGGTRWVLWTDYEKADAA